MQTLSRFPHRSQSFTTLIALKPNQPRHAWVISLEVGVLAYGTVLGNIVLTWSSETGLQICAGRIHRFLTGRFFVHGRYELIHSGSNFMKFDFPEIENTPTK